MFIHIQNSEEIVIITAFVIFKFFYGGISRWDVKKYIIIDFLLSLVSIATMYLVILFSPPINMALKYILLSTIFLILSIPQRLISTPQMEQFVNNLTDDEYNVNRSNDKDYDAPNLTSQRTNYKQFIVGSIKMTHLSNCRYGLNTKKSQTHHNYNYRYNKNSSFPFTGVISTHVHNEEAKIKTNPTTQSNIVIKGKQKLRLIGVLDICLLICLSVTMSLIMYVRTNIMNTNDLFMINNNNPSVLQVQYDYLKFLFNIVSNFAIVLGTGFGTTMLVLWGGNIWNKIQTKTKYITDIQTSVRLFVTYVFIAISIFICILSPILRTMKSMAFSLQ